ncbi:MAG: glycosyl transferase [Acidimicrobiaceae bacterium]|nr:glycosyl transferase [Acidimicrobiaceae bacterium]
MTTGPRPATRASEVRTGSPVVIPGRDPKRGCLHPPELVAVVVPARDEEERITRCLDALRAAAGHPCLSQVEVRLVLVLDRCSDSTPERASEVLAGWGGAVVLESREGTAGGARRLGFAQALRLAQGRDPADVWLATTDADSVVPRDWLARQLAWRALGAEAIAGTVTVERWTEQPVGHARRFARYLAVQGAGFGHPHVHGANLSCSASAYLACGGVPPVATGEDRLLWLALAEAGTASVAVSDLPVITSARREGRAPDGFAGFLGELGDSRQHG